MSGNYVADFDTIKSKVAKLRNEASDSSYKVDQLQQELKQTQEQLENEKNAKETLERKLHQVEGDAFTTQNNLEETIKDLKEKLDREEGKSGELEREVNKMRMENEALEKKVVEWEDRFKDLVANLGQTITDLQNV